jgi:ketosteroid isomerase-like protein
LTRATTLSTRIRRAILAVALAHASVAHGAATSSLLPPTDTGPVLINPGNQANSDALVSYPQAITSDGAKGYWRLDLPGGTSAQDSIGSNPGTLLGGITLGQAGALADGDAAVQLDATTGYVRVPNAPSLQLAGDLTLELWVKLGSLATRQTLISKGYAREFELTLETNGALNFYQGNGTSYSNAWSSPGTVVANTWQHVVVTRDGTTQTVRFYVNGSARGSGVPAIAATVGTTDITIGRSSSANQYVNGLIDEVAIYGAVLTPTQVATHWVMRLANGTSTPVQLPLVASDPDGDALIYSATGLPTGLSVNGTTGLISGTLTAASAGTYVVTASASDGPFTSSQTFTWTVTHVNHAPTLTAPGSQSSAEAATVTLQLVAGDLDGDALTYSATGLPPGLSVNATTGLISGTLPYATAGIYAVTVMAGDAGMATSQSFAWTVTHTNRAPVLVNPGPQANLDAWGYAQAIEADKPAGYWRLDASGGTVAGDSSGASRTGTVVGGGTLGQPGALTDGSTALQLDGTTGYVRVANDASLQLGGNLTLELWVKPASLATRQTLISKGYLREFELTLETNGTLNLYQGNGTIYSDALSTVGAIVANTWQHVVVTRDGATQTVRFYVNGVARGSGVPAVAATGGTSDITIGRSSSATQYVNGVIDEVAIYAAVLTPAQVTSHWAMRLAGLSYPKTVQGDSAKGYWRLDLGSGTTAGDSSGTNPGALVGGVTLGQAGALADGDGAVQLDGTTGYIRVPNAPALQLAGDLTLELWVKLGSLATRQTLISKGYAREFELTLETDGTLNFYQGNGTSYSNAWSSPGAVVANSWHHVVVTRDGATQTVRFYVNGAARGSGVPAIAATVGTTDVTIGRSRSGNQYVNGLIDEVAIYAAVLTPTQVATHWAMRLVTAGGTPVQLPLVASDPDSDALSFSATGLPPGLTLNGTTGLISGTLTTTSVGIYTVTATASDGRLSQSQAFTWTVTHANHPPTLTMPGNQTSAEAATVTLPLVASDLDGDALTYSATGLPPGLSVNPTSGLISGTLPYTTAGIYAVTVMAADTSTAALQSFIWTVTHTNRAPTLVNPGSQTNTDTWTYPQTVQGDNAVGYWWLDAASGTTAADSSGSNPGTLVGGVTLGQAGALADGDAAVRLDGATGYVRVPNNASLQLGGDLTLELWVKLASLATRQTLISKGPLREFELTLETDGTLNFYQGNGTIYGNTVSAVGAIVANTWQHVVMTRESATQTVRFYVNGVPRGAGVPQVTATAGNTDITIGRSSGGTRYVNGLIDEVAIYATTLTPAQVAMHWTMRLANGTGRPVQLPLVATDPDGDVLNFSATGLPPELTVNATTGVISGTLTAASSGTYTVTATVSDGPLANSQSFTWTVLHINHAPALRAPGSIVLDPFTSTRVNGDSPPVPLFSAYTGDCAGCSGQTSSIGDGLFVLNVPDGMYMHFLPWPYLDPLGFAHGRITAGTWTATTPINRLYFAFTPPKTIPAQIARAGIIQFGTYTKPVTDTEWSNQGAHYYHMLNTGLTAGQRTLCIFNDVPQHQVGADDPSPSYQPVPGYFYGLTRFYFGDNDSQSGENGTWTFEPITFGYVANEPDTYVSSLCAHYTGTAYELSWQGGRNVVWSYTVFTLNANGSLGASLGVAQTQGDGYTAVDFVTPPMAQNPATCFGIQPQGSTTYSKICPGQ